MTLSLSRRAEHWSDRIGVVDHDANRELSYAELDDRAAATARRLAASGVGEGDAVCVLSRNRVEHLALLFACRRLGATLAPLSHRLDEEAIAALGDRIDPALVLHEGRFAEQAEAVDGDAATLDEFAETQGEDSDRIDPGPHSEAPLVYLHTGGTTGVPKVVIVSHRQVEWNCITEVAAWGLGKTDVSPVLLPLYHTGGWNLLTLPTLYVGGKVVLHREFDPDAALAGIESHGATHVFGVAAILRAIADADRFDDADLSSVDWVMSGGGPTPEAVFDAYRDRGLRLTQGYGLTEGGPNNLYLDPDRDVDRETIGESVGRPFPDCETRIVDPDGEPVDPGEVGELEIRGPVAAREYLETEDGTFEGVRASEASAGTEDVPPSGKWVSTGDLARIDGDGNHYITGRTDNMFVSGGENVHPEAIEAALESHPAVADVGVIPVPHDRWGRVPKAVVVPEEGGDVDDPEGAFESFAREHLAGFELPRAWAIVDGLPRSGPGKLDRGELERRHGVSGGDEE